MCSHGLNIGSGVGSGRPGPLKPLSFVTGVAIVISFVATDAHRKLNSSAKCLLNSWFFFVADAQRASKQKSVLHVVALLVFFSVS